MSNKKEFYVQDGMGSDDVRVYIPLDAPEEVHAYFKSICRFGVADGRGENFLSYEVKNHPEWIKGC